MKKDNSKSNKTINEKIAEVVCKRFIVQNPEYKTILDNPEIKIFVIKLLTNLINKKKLRL